MIRPSLQDAERELSRHKASTPYPDAHVAAALSANILGRTDTASLDEAFNRLAAEPPGELASNRLREVTVLQSLADLLGKQCPRQLDESDFEDSFAPVRDLQKGLAGLLDDGVALALRYKAGAIARAAIEERRQAKVTVDVVTLTHLLHTCSAPALDAQSTAELGYLCLLAIRAGSGVNVRATVLTLAAIHGPEALRSMLKKQARRFDEASGGLDVGEPRWRLEKGKRIALTVVIRGNGKLHDAAPWAFDEVVYRLPEHVEALMSKSVPFEEIEGAKSKSAALKAASERGIETHAVLDGVSIGDDDLAALEARQDAALSWVRESFPELRDWRAKIQIVSA